MKKYTIEDLKTFERDKKEILFRGKTQENKWVYWNEYGELVGIGGKKRTRYSYHLTTNSISYYYTIQQLKDSNLLIEKTVGQFTGLTDKNDKKVFEGDFIGFVNSANKLVLDGIVKYGNFNCSCCDGVYGWYVEDGDIRDLEKPNDFYKVIGNIHDIIELL